MCLRYIWMIILQKITKKIVSPLGNLTDIPTTSHGWIVLSFSLFWNARWCLGFTRYDLRITKVKEKHFTSYISSGPSRLGCRGSQQSQWRKINWHLCLPGQCEVRRGAELYGDGNFLILNMNLLCRASIELNYYSEFEIPLVVATTLHTVQC